MADAIESRAKVLESCVDDVRNLTTCKICLKPFYEPYILACGHTYCYGCLKSWFGGQQQDRKKRKNCPDCRTEVVAQPAPNYLLRDLVHLLVKRSEFLPEDETVEDHRRGQEEEATLLTNDKAGNGIFGGMFKPSGYARFQHPLVDLEDGVERCPSCGWELEDGPGCWRCGWTIDDEGFSDSYDSDLDDGFSDVSSHSTIPGILRHSPQRFYGIHSDADDTESDYDDYDPSRAAPIDLDHYDENDDFIDNDDYSDEVDHDDIDGLSPVSLTTAGEDSLADTGPTLYQTNPVIRILDSSPQSSEDEAATNYDGSDVESVTSTQRLYNSRRARRVISDDEDEDEQGGSGSSSETGFPTGFSTSGISTDITTTISTDSDSNSDSTSTSGNEDEESSNGDDSDDTIIPPQSRDRRRQRLDNHRSRRVQSSQPFGYSVQVSSRDYGRPNRNARPTARRSQVGYVY